MKIQEYQKAALRTMAKLENKSLDIMHMNLGLITEVGEIADIFKKELAYKKPVDVINLKEEIGDCLWYIANMASIFNCNIEYDPVDSEYFFKKHGSKYPFKPFIIPIIMQDAIFNITSYCATGNADKLSEVITEELQQLIINLDSLCIHFKLDIEECIFLNIEKLYRRYPEKFSEDLALKRNLEEERKTLEM